MSYVLYDTDGYVGDLSSIHDYTATIKFVEQFQNLKELNLMVDQGYTDEMDAVVEEINKIMPKATDEAVKGCLEALLEGLKKSKEITIISQ